MHVAAHYKVVSEDSLKLGKILEIKILGKRGKYRIWIFPSTLQKCYVIKKIQSFN